MIDDLVEDLASTFKIAVKKVSFKDSWNARPPVEAGQKSMALYLENVSFSFLYHA
jgi:hypothetical protein